MPAPDPQRIAKLLARAGIASRREVERMIAEGRVAKDGVVLDTPATVLPSLQGVTVDGQPVEAPEPARLFLYHKPPGLLVTEHDPGGRATIYDRLPPELPRVVPVGRLDLGTEGLLLLTTDGGLKRQLELPATGVERAYRARAYGPVTQAQLEDLIEGVEIEGVRYGSINANLERRTGTNVWIELILTEGKNREVRRVLEHLGLRVSRLIRTRYGPFVLGDLPPGEVGEVRRHDVDSFRKHPTRVDLPQPARGRSGGVEAVGRSAVRAESGARPQAARHAPARAVGTTPAVHSPRPVNDRLDRAVRDLRPAPRQERVATAPQRPAPASRNERRIDPGPSRARSATANERVANTPRTQTAHPSAAGGGRARAPDNGPQRPRTGGAPVKPDARPGKVANPARAARARAHRDATGRPEPGPPKPGRPAGKPRSAPPRPPRTRK